MKTKFRNLEISDFQHGYQIKRIWKAEAVLLELNYMSDVKDWGKDDPSIIICMTWHKPGVPSHHLPAISLQMRHLSGKWLSRGRQRLILWWKECYDTSQIIQLKTVFGTVGLMSVPGPSWPHHHVLSMKIQLCLAFSAGTSQHLYHTCTYLEIVQR